MDSTGAQTAHPQAQPLRFRCPGCQQVLQVSAKYAGHKVKCSQCEQLLQVPGVPAQPHPAQALKPKKFIICICAACKHIFKTPPDTAHQHVNCPSCNHAVEIPTQPGRVTDTDTFRFKCTSCQQEYCVLSKYGGKKFTCLACKEATAIPIPVSAPPPPAPEMISPDMLDMPDVVEDDIPQYQLQEEPQDENTAGPSEFDVGAAEQSAPRPKGKKAKSGGSSVMSKLKVPLIVIGGAVGFIIGFVVVTSLMKGDPVPDVTIPTQSPEAIAFAEENITLLAGMKPRDVQFRFRDEVSVNPDMMKELAYAVSLGEIESIASEVTYANVGEGAAGYIVESVISYAGRFTRTVHAGICIGTEYTFDEYGYEESSEQYSSLLSMKVLDADGLELHAIGETADYLITQLDAFVVENELLEFGGINPTFACTILAVLLVLGLVTLFSQIAVFTSAGESGWAVFVPIYREVCMARIAEKPEFLGIVCGLAFMIPTIGSFVYYVLFCVFSVGIARAFNRGVLFGLGLAFLPFIFYPILAFSGNAYD